MTRIPLDTKYFKANRYKQLFLVSYSIRFFNYCLFNHFTINFTYLLLSKQNNKKRVQTNIKRVILSVHWLLSIKNQFLSVQIPLQIYHQIILTYGIFSGSFLDNLE